MARALTDIDVARAAVLERVSTLPAERVPLPRALGRVLAADVASGEAIPPFDNAAMDGYAIRAADTDEATPQAPVSLRVVDESRAGTPATSEPGPGEAVAISTGAVIPQGCDAIVPIEEAGGGNGTIQVNVPVERGRDIRRAGDDIAAGEGVVAKGTALGPAELGVLASVGLTAAPCARQPRVTVLTTGDELVPPGEDRGPGKIRDANARSVPALAQAAGAEVTRVDRVGDGAVAVRSAVAAILDADVAVVCGGISVGEHDHVRAALTELGVKEIFWGLALRPGRPTWFGAAPGGALAFGLPGNPVSAMVAFILFVRPALLALVGASPAGQHATARFDVSYQKQPGRAHAVRVRLDVRDDGWHARPTKDQASHILTSMLADALAIIPADRGDVGAGDRVQIEFLSPGRPAPGSA
jgi:molybdopterin molybdotransferase